MLTLSHVVTITQMGVKVDPKSVYCRAKSSMVWKQSTIHSVNQHFVYARAREHTHTHISMYVCMCVRVVFF